MLDQDTKRKIDNARDILVGKVPDPKSQVEQITIALIYKFMDDMDKQSEEMGGKASFFTGKYKKYAWSTIFDPRLGGFDLIGLYGDAIVEMNQNPNIPQLFRDIFKNAYLPYRDPETLKSFLKEINEFSYDHSEQLGNAFEYLLSVLGSQGDAGQFRTPRHIIDFIVEIVAPKKNETVLDPACGTAGFLISSYKHILKANTKKQNGDQLTPDERKRLLNNFMGYDISPDMVRLSLVNLYLHGFSDPKIVEYDTLTSEERWNDTADVILANPPFMTPKGGIRPHKRFSIQAKRSEVLFVDYIAEHLNPSGRAGIIVPEGIIFQSQNAYKNLRKMLVDDYLWAVVSLPAGVFNPYSGVKTSVLLMDKALNKKTDKILFVKIDNDGFDLGAQRRANGKDDLPTALGFIKGYKKAVMKGTEAEGTNFAHVVEKTKIAESGDWNLSGDRYQDNRQIQNHDWEMVLLGDERYFKIEAGGTPSSKNPDFWDGDINWVTLVDIPQDNFITEISESKRKITKEGLDKSSAKLLPANSILVSSRATIGRIAISRTELATNQGFKNIVIKDFNSADEKFIALALTQLVDDMIRMASGGTFKEISRTSLCKLKIPLPPLDVQKAIVEEIDGYQKIIDGARQVVDNYKPTIKIDPEWEVVALGEVMSVNSNTLNPKDKYGDEEFVYIEITSVENGTGIVSFDNLVKGTEAPSRARRIVNKGDILLSTVRPNLKAFSYLSEVPKNAIASTGFAVLSPKNKVVPQFVYYQLFGEYLQKQMIDRMGKGSYPSINQKDVQELQIPLPPVCVQQEIVAQLEAEQEIVTANKRFISIFEQKIKDKIAEVWGG